MVEIPDQKVNYTELGFSDDPYEAKLLFHWTNKKYTRCRHYRDFLNKCFEQDLVSEDQEDNTPFIELLRQVGWWDLTIKMLGKAGMEEKYKLSKDRCRIFNSLVTICYADNVFYQDHIDPSLIWVSTVVNKTWDSLNKTLPPTLETKSRSKRQVQAVANSLLGTAKKGMVKKFLFSLMGPVLKELKSVGQKEAARAVAKHIIPYTGINDHGTGHIVNQLLN